MVPNFYEQDLQFVLDVEHLLRLVYPNLDCALHMLDRTCLQIVVDLKPEVIAVNQDAAGHQGTVIATTCPPPIPMPYLNDDVLPCQQVWGKPLGNGNWAVVLLNYDPDAASTIVCDATCMTTMGFSSGAFVRDLWLHRDIGRMETLSMEVPADGASIMLVLSAPARQYQ